MEREVVQVTKDKFHQEIARQEVFIKQFIKDKSDLDKINRMNGDMLAYILIELTAMYEYLGSWLADYNAAIQDFKQALNDTYSATFLELRKETDGKKITVEEAKHKASLSVSDQRDQLIHMRHKYEKTLAWKKSISKYIDAVRSQLSYEKSLADLTKEP